MKKSIAFILCFSILLSTFIYQIPGVSASEKSVHILHDGKQINELTIQQNEKEELTADVIGIGKTDYQWQLLLDHQNSVWVNIYDKTDRECEVSYALLKNLLDDAGSTYIRCSVTKGSETFYSEAVCVTVAPAYATQSQVISFAKAELVQNAAREAAATLFSMSRDAGSEYVTVTIKYLDLSSLDGNESAIYSPYTATIEKGTNFNQNVVSPTFLGFAPIYAKDSDGLIDDDASTICLDLENVTEDVEIKVYYEPIEVNFAIRYFFQNINDDLYTENVRLYHADKAKTGTIIEDDYLREYAGDTTGFEKMYHIPETVAADGSTVFECYYDRNYYLIQFDLNGGYGVDPIYARYGTPFMVNEPVRHGYRFVGWDRLYDADNDGVPDTGDGKADVIGTTIGTENEIYLALWESVDTTYTRAYWVVKDNGDREYLGAIRTPATSGDTVSGSDDLETQYKKIFRFDEHTHSMEAGCYGNCEFSKHRHDVKCYTNQTLTQEENLTNTQKTVYQNLKQKVTDPVEGNIYKYRQSWNNYYNFFYLNGTWYYLGTGTAYGSISLSGSLNNPSSNGNYTTAAAKATCAAASHTHIDACLSCQKLVHVHDDSCNPNPRYYEFYIADEDIVVDGDGSSVVNVYYKPKEYTLRFFYARSSGSGDNITYEVVGGSTYAFGGVGVDDPGNCSVRELLSSVPSGNWGEVTSLPVFYPNSDDTKVDIDNYTLGTYTETGNSYTYYYFEFKARYGDDISAKWPVGILAPVEISGKHSSHSPCYNNAYFSAWNGEYKVGYTQNHLSTDGNLTIKGRYMVLDEKLLYDAKFEDSDTVTYLGFWENGADIGWSVPKLFRYHLMLESPNGQITEYEYNGAYFDEFQVFRTFDNSTLDGQTYTSIPGYTYVGRTDSAIEGGFYSQIGKETIKDAYEVYFWYTRNDYTLTYFNYENVLNSVSVPYDTIFTEEEFYKQPERYPPSLEPNAYEFVGWYTSPMRIYPIEFDKDKMPGEDVIWYAKWVPVTHKVNFFASYDDMTAYESGTTTAEPYKSFDNIDHGTMIGQNVEKPSKTGSGDMELTFAGWFYMENGEKKAFTPLNMPINRDLNIFADWSSSSPQPYHLQYVLLDDPDEKVAEDISGFAYAGSTRTFTAKAGNPYNQLYDKYNLGYFPTVASHSITMQYEDDKDHPKFNVSTFYYVYAADIEYTVRYVNKETNTVMGEQTKHTSDAIVTERFQAYENMVPDAFYKRLVLSVEYDEETGKYVGSKENVITFYYTPNTTSAYYAVHFMLEKLDATDSDKQNFAIDGSGGYAESETYVEGIGNIGSSVSVIPQEFSGFSLIPDQAISVADGVQNKTGYADGQYKITVTDKGTELYIFYERLDYDYTVHYYLYNTTKKLVDDITDIKPYGSSVTETALNIQGYSCVSAQTKTISIRSDSNQNVIIFYYAPVQYVAEYVAVPGDGGLLSSTIEVVTGEEALAGSVPTANAYYSFDGWYCDEACTQSASEYGSIDEADNRFIPDKTKLSETERNIFYAKFTRKAGDLTIVRNNAEDDGQVFVYAVKNNVTDEVITVTIAGNDSVTIKDLPFGSYIVTQINDWSWRYDDKAITVDHQGENGTTVQFSNAMVRDKWLNGNSALIQNQRGKSA